MPIDNTAHERGLEWIDLIRRHLAGEPDALAAELARLEAEVEADRPAPRLPYRDD